MQDKIGQIKVYENDSELLIRYSKQKFFISLVFLFLWVNYIDSIITQVYVESIFIRVYNGLYGFILVKKSKNINQVEAFSKLCDTCAKESMISAVIKVSTQYLLAAKILFDTGFHFYENAAVSKLFKRL